MLSYLDHMWSSGNVYLESGESGDRAVRALVLGSSGGILVCEEKSGHGRPDIEAVFQWLEEERDFEFFQRADL